MKTYEGFIKNLFKKKIGIDDLKVGDYIAYSYPYPSSGEMGKIVDIKSIKSAGNFHKGKLFHIQTELNIEATTLLNQEIRYLTEAEIEDLDMKLNAKKYNL